MSGQTICDKHFHGNQLHYQKRGFKMSRFKTIAVCRIIVIVSAIMTFSAAKAGALNAPYLTSATPTNGHSIALTWRNNDFAATQVLILRKTATTAWVVKDSVAGTVTSYTDSTLLPLNGYSFALLATAPGQRSDTSNVLNATTLKAAEIFAVPGIEVLWVEGQKFITVKFFDSSNTEKGFRLFRKSLADPWAAIDSIITNAPVTNAWKVFGDSSISDNTWYTYKVQVYNDSQSAFSPETTVYNYARPKNVHSYTIVKKGSIPAKPISWVERIGDSLYFPEVAAPGDTQISVVDVSNSLSPEFRGYVSPKNIPAWLKWSVVEARVSIPSTGSLFTHRNGYYIVSERDSIIYQYDSATLAVHDSIKLLLFPNFIGGQGHRLIGWLNDSCCSVGISAFTGMGEGQGVWPVHFGSGGIDEFPQSMSWSNSSSMGYSSFRGIWGCYKNKMVFCSINSTRYLGSTYTYSFQDFSTGFTTPRTFSEIIKDPIFYDAKSMVIDTSIVFTTTIIYGGPNAIPIGKTLYAFNIADAYSGPDHSFLGKLDDSNFACGNVKEIQVDSKKKCAYIIGDSGISIYSYSIGPVGVRPSTSISRNSALKRLSVSQNPRGVSFSIIGAKMQSLQVLNARGQIVRSVIIPAGETFVWNRQDNAGRVVPVGFYIYKIGTLKDGVIAGTMALVR